jgi:hypothetical protein
MEENGGKFVLIERITGKLVSRDIYSDCSLDLALRFKSEEDARAWRDAQKDLSHIQKKNLKIDELKE